MGIVKLRNRSGSIRYQVKVRDSQGRWFPTPSFISLAEAKAEELRLINKKKKSRVITSDDARTTTVADYWEVWSVENRQEVSDGWKMSQNQMFRDYIKPVIGTLTMLEVGKPEIGKVLNRAKEKGTGEQTRKHIYSLLRRMFGDAVEYYEMLDQNPVQARWHRPRVPLQRRNFLPPEQALRLLEACKGTYLGPPTWIMMLSALRISEVQALTWERVRLDAGQILISAAFNKKTKLIQDFPKQQDWAYSPIPALLKSYLMELPNREPKAFVAPGPDGESMLSYDTYIKALAQLCLRAKVPVITPHELRHSATELWVKNGATVEDIRRLLNHSNVSATMRYIHRTDDRLMELGKDLGKPGVTLRSENGA